MSVRPLGVDHVSINVPDVPAALDFYTNVLGLVQNFERPDFDFAGAWLDVGPGGQQVHLLGFPTPENKGQHFALLYEDLDSVVEGLRAHGLEVSDPVPSGPNRHQAFLTDPWGNRIELHQHPQVGAR
jgi:catechol 2,3-dioxygenase-like lactoylglutathione lyase family enzyme